MVFSFYSASASASASSSIQEKAYIWIEERAAVHVKALTDQQSATCSTWEKGLWEGAVLLSKKKKKNLDIQDYHAHVVKKPSI